MPARKRFLALGYPGDTPEFHVTDMGNSVGAVLFQRHGFTRVLPKSRSDISAIREELVSLSDGDAFCVYLAAHSRYGWGTSPEDPPYPELMMADGALDTDSLRRALEPPYGRQLHVTLLLETCYAAGEAVPDRDLPSALGLPSVLAGKRGRFVILAASRDDETADVGAFTDALLLALNKDVAPKTLIELRAQVETNLRAAGYSQTPFLYGPQAMLTDHPFTLAGAAVVP